MQELQLVPAWQDGTPQLLPVLTYAFAFQYV